MQIKPSYNWAWDRPGPELDNSNASCLTYAHAVQGVQMAALVLVVAGPGPVPALGAAVSGLGAHNAGHGGQQWRQAVVTVAGVEGGQEHAGEGALLKQDLPLLHSLCSCQVPPSRLITGGLKPELLTGSLDLTVFSKLLTVTIISILLLLSPGLQPQSLIAQGTDILRHGVLLVLHELGSLQRLAALLQPLLTLLILAQPQPALSRPQMELVLQGSLLLLIFC